MKLLRRALPGAVHTGKQIRNLEAIEYVITAMLSEGNEYENDDEEEGEEQDDDDDEEEEEEEDVEEMDEDFLSFIRGIDRHARVMMQHFMVKIQRPAKVSNEVMPKPHKW